MKKFLHVGCGGLRQQDTPFAGERETWQEIRMDVDAKTAPDILGSMTDMSAVPNGEFDAVFSSHSIEHLYPHEVPTALAEFRRVLKSTGFALITCPDLQSVCTLVAAGKLTDTAYISPAGPITALDILYGWRKALAQGELHMAHRCGFTQILLTEELKRAGFVAVASKCCESPHFDLWALGYVTLQAEVEVRGMATKLFPK